MRLNRRITGSSRVLEYFVVCSVVVLMVSISIALFQNTLRETRDAKRVSEIASIRTALELYHLDHGTYPQTGWVNSTDDSWNILAQHVRPYLPELPRDPLNESSGKVEYTGAFNYSYYSAPTGDAAGKEYMIIFRLERPGRAEVHQRADVGIVTSHGTFSFKDITGKDGLYSFSSAR